MWTAHSICRIQLEEEEEDSQRPMLLECDTVDAEDDDDDCDVCRQCQPSLSCLSGSSVFTSPPSLHVNLADGKLLPFICKFLASYCVV